MTRLGTALLCAALLASCATPVAPSGGPVDSTPPRIAASEPPPGSVNVTDRSVRITFSEYVEETSFDRALAISPEPAAPPDVSWDGRSVVIRLPDELRPNTTYVVTLNTELRDIRNVALESPITFAFATGPTINAGTLTGRVVRPQAGSPVAGVDVFAYALPDGTAPDSLPARPAYRTQTDQSGAFVFEYMTEQFYYVAALRDQNRNLRPDPEEEFAAPPVPALFADTASVALETPWVMTRVDSTSPVPLRVQSLAASRHAVRMSEPVRFVDRDPSTWELRDSTTGAAATIYTLYMHEDDPRQIFFTTSPLDPSPLVLRPSALVDTSRNALEERSVTFTPSTADDTLRHRFLSFLPAGVTQPAYILPRRVEPGLRFNAPVDEDLLGRAVTVVDSSGTALPFAAVTDDGTTYRLLPEPPLARTGGIAVRVDGSELAGPDSVSEAAYRRFPSSESGEIRGVAASPVPPVVVEVFPVEIDVSVPRYDTQADSSGTFVFSGLPAGTYRLRAFGDRDRNGIWSGGRLIPYVPPEPIVWITEPTRVRARWETSLPDTLRIRAPR